MFTARSRLSWLSGKSAMDASSASTSAKVTDLQIAPSISFPHQSRRD